MASSVLMEEVAEQLEEVTRESCWRFSREGREGVVERGEVVRTLGVGAPSMEEPQLRETAWEVQREGEEVLAEWEVQMTMARVEEEEVVAVVVVWEAQLPVLTVQPRVVSEEARRAAWEEERREVSTAVRQLVWRGVQPAVLEAVVHPVSTEVLPLVSLEEPHWV